MTTDSQIEAWAKEIRKTGIWMAEEEGSETILESGLGKFKIPKPLAEVTKLDVQKAIAPEIIAELWKDHGHAHDAHGNDIHEDGHSHEGHGHDGHEHGHDGHGHGHEGHGHGHDGHGECCDGHGHDGHDNKEKTGHKGHGHDDSHGHKGHGHDEKHGHGHDGHGDCCDGHGHDGHDNSKEKTGHGHGHDDHGHKGHGHDDSKEKTGHGHGHDDSHGHKGHGHDDSHGHGHDGHGDCCGGHGDGHDSKTEKAGHGHGHEGHGHAHGHAHGHKEGECAKIVGVGVVKLAGETFSVDREGQCESGKTCEFGVERVGQGKASGFEAWVENVAGERVSELVKAEAHGEHWHFMVTPKAGAQASKFALRLGEEVDKVDIHPGAAPCHDGISTPIYDKNGKIAGFLELKLHDDAGDLEIWISCDGAMTQPMDIPANTIVKASFLAHGGRSVDLKVRNNDQNEDEDKKANMRDGKTNYFIFPGETGEDSSWLQGEKFRSMVEVTFAVGAQMYKTSPFTIVGHSQY